MDNVVTFPTPAQDSAVTELRRQLEQGYALVAVARAYLQREGSCEVEPADRVLEMAEDVLSEREYIDRIDPSRTE